MYPINPSNSRTPCFERTKLYATQRQPPGPFALHNLANTLLIGPSSSRRIQRYIQPRYQCCVACLFRRQCFFVQLPNLGRSEGSGLGKLGTPREDRALCETSGGGKCPWVIFAETRRKRGSSLALARRQLGSEPLWTKVPDLLYIFRTRDASAGRKDTEGRETAEKTKGVALPVLSQPGSPRSRLPFFLLLPRHRQPPSPFVLPKVDD